MAGEHAMTDQEVWIPAQRHAARPEHDATMVLPIYNASATAAAAHAPTAAPVVEQAPLAAAIPATRRRARKADALPSDERNMLIFVSLLLLMGTLAIVAMASIGR